MLSPWFISESVFYTQSVMLSPRFIPESVFYTQSVVRSPQSAVRSPQSAVRSPQSAVRSPQSAVHILYWPVGITLLCKREPSKWPRYLTLFWLVVNTV